MSTFTVPITVGASEDGPKERLVAWVDTGSIYCWMPADLLARLGISSHSTRTFTLADGRQVEQPIGRAWITVDGRSEPTIVVVGKAGSQALLGAYALEGLALAADPLNEQLVPMPRLNAF